MPVGLATSAIRNDAGVLLVEELVLAASAGFASEPAEWPRDSSSSESDDDTEQPLDGSAPRHPTAEVKTRSLDDDEEFRIADFLSPEPSEAFEDGNGSQTCEFPVTLDATSADELELPISGNTLAVEVKQAACSAAFCCVSSALPSRKVQ